MLTLYVALGNNPPVISTDPKDVMISLRHGNESAVFSCEANGGSNDIQYRWFNKTSDGDMMLEGTSNMLMLSPVTVEMNNTQFYCVASNNSGSDTSESAHLTVTSKPTMCTLYK